MDVFQQASSTSSPSTAWFRDNHYQGLRPPSLDTTDTTEATDVDQYPPCVCGSTVYKGPSTFAPKRQREQSGVALPGDWYGNRGRLRTAACSVLSCISHNYDVHVAESASHAERRHEDIFPMGFRL